MIPGLVSKLSEKLISLTNTITQESDIIRVTSTTSTTVLTNIFSPVAGGLSGSFLVIINSSGANMTTVTTGNIQTAVTIGQNVSTLFVYSPSAAKWYPGALA